MPRNSAVTLLKLKIIIRFHCLALFSVKTSRQTHRILRGRLYLNSQGIRGASYGETSEIFWIAPWVEFQQNSDFESCLCLIISFELIFSL